MDVTEDFSLGEVQAEVDRLLAKSHMYGATPIPGLMNHWAEGFVWYNHNEPMCKESIALFNAGQMLAHYIFCSHGGDIFDD